MSAKVSVNLGTENVELNLEYNIKNNEMNISLHDDEGEEIISDKLSQFQTIDIDDNVPLQIALKGPKSSRVIRFLKESDASDFFTTIQKIAKLTQLPGEKHSFILTIEPQQVNLSDYIPLVGFFNKTISSTVKTVKNIVIGKELEVPKQEKQVHTDGFRLGYIKESLSKDDIKMEDFDPSKIESLNNIDFKSSSGLSSDIELINLSTSLQRVSHLLFSKEQIYSIWCKILLPRGKTNDELFEDYKKIGVQWKTFSKGQWDHSYQLRSFVVNVEKSLKKSKILSVSPYDRVSFDVLLSMFAFHFSNFQFNKYFIQFLEILIPTCVKNVVKNGNDDNGDESFTFETHLGESLDIDKLCSTVFWMFKSFSERFIIMPPPGSKNKKFNSKPKSNKSDQNDQNLNANLAPTPSFNINDTFLPGLPELFLSVKSQLSSISPSTNSLLETRGIKTLDFCFDDFKSFFVSGRPLEEAQLFITAMIAASNIPQFLSGVLCSVLVLLQSTLQKVPPIDDASSTTPDDDASRAEIFKKVFNASLKSLDMRLILYNEEGVCGNRSRALKNQKPNQPSSNNENAD